MTQPLLLVQNLVKHFPRSSGLFGSDGGVVQAVDGISFEVAPGEVLGLVGESGSGKSTTGRLILRLLEATAGQVIYEGVDVLSLSKAEMRELRKKMQIVFQDPYGAFNPRMTVGAIVGEALELRGLPRKQRLEKVAQYLELVQMPADAARRYPHEFSGGQRQRVGIARALAVEPRFIVADEPLSALDVSTQAEIINLLLDLQKRLELTMLFISHDLSVVRVLCDRIAVMNAGKIVETGDVAQIFGAPKEQYTRELLEAIPVADPSAARHAPSS
jgi:ABC-type oligopeptide transport system ATPase subunit